MNRHGAMVLNICGNVLCNEHDAQDAFQATFLVLASRAHSIQRPDALASWLLGVAQRVAVRARADGARRREREKRAVETKVDRDENRPEAWPELHEEIARLPERYRQPVVLCYLEGLSTEAAALRLGCPHGTVLSRLARARDRLRSGLTRRGMAPPAGLLIAGLAPEATRAAIPAALLEATVQASLRFAKQPATAASLSSTTAMALARGVMTTMMLTKLKILGAAAVACLLAMGGFHALARQFDGDAPGASGQAAGVEKQSGSRQVALFRTVDRLQADLARSAQLNAQLRKELDELRVNLEAIRAAQSEAVITKAPPTKAKKEMPAKPQAAQQGSYTQVGNLIVAASARGDKVVAYRVDSGKVRSLRLGMRRTLRLKWYPL